MFRVKRRLSGAAGAPSTLGSGQLAWSSVDRTLYIGDGDNGSGVATTVVPLVNTNATGNFASTAYVDTKIAEVVNGAGAALDTLNELAAALGNDANFSATVSAQINARLAKSAVSDYMMTVIAAVDQGTARTLLGAAPATHSHAIGEITGLTAALGNKLDASAYTAEDILAKLKTVDGQGSGLDADTIASVTPSAFGLQRLQDADDAATRNALGLVIGTVSEFLQNIASRMLTIRAVWDSAKFVNVASAASITLDANAGYNFNIDPLSVNTTIAFTNVKPGQSGTIRIKQDATGGRTATMGAGIVKPAGSAPVLSTAPNAVDYLDWHAFSATEIRIALSKDWK